MGTLVGTSGNQWEPVGTRWEPVGTSGNPGGNLGGNLVGTWTNLAPGYKLQAARLQVKWEPWWEPVGTLVGTWVGTWVPGRLT